MINVVALLGSQRQESMTRLALNVALEGVRKAGLEHSLKDLGAPRLPLFEEGVTGNDPAVLQFKEAIRGCDALLVATPVYHDSYSGVLKNAIDHLYDELSDKVIGLVAVGGGRTGQGQALEHLRAVFRETNSWVLPRQVAIPSSKEAFEAGKLKDPELEFRLLKLGQELVLRARQLRPKKPAVARSP
jgi:NAD(P)H-dependent FMN reductase